jgi:hypothetical protein
MFSTDILAIGQSALLQFLSEMTEPPSDSDSDPEYVPSPSNSIESDDGWHITEPVVRLSALPDHGTQSHGEPSSDSLQFNSGDPQHLNHLSQSARTILLCDLKLMLANGQPALTLLNQVFKLDWASENPVDLFSKELEWRVEHFIDYLCLEGKPFTPIDQGCNKIFDVVMVDLKNWSKRYDNLRYYVGRYPHRVGRSVRLATTPSFDWYLIVYFPHQSQESLPSHPIPLTSAMFIHLFGFFIYIFEQAHELFAHGVNRANVTLNNYTQKRWKLSSTQWNTFQDRLFNDWEPYWSKYGPNCWAEAIPVMHIMSHGGNNVLRYNADASTEDLVPYFVSSFENLWQMQDINSISFALASEVSVESEDRGPIAILADAAQISKQYPQPPRTSSLEIYPMAFSSSASNWQSVTMPEFYRQCIYDVAAQLDLENQPTDGSVLQPRSFQGYSTIKQQIRPSKADFPFGHSVHTGAYCVEPSMLSKSGKARHEKLKFQADCGKAFDEISGAVALIQTQSGANYRFEPVITIHVDRLNVGNKTLQYLSEKVLCPMVQVWHRQGIHMSRQVLKGHSYEVSPSWARPAHIPSTLTRFRSFLPSSKRSMGYSAQQSKS